jgi:hypothetical protein
MYSYVAAVFCLSMKNPLSNATIYEIELGKAMSSWIVIHDFLNENGNITKNMIETKTKN